MTFLRQNYAGLVILLAMLIGGGPGKGLWTDHLIEAAMLPTLFMGLPHLTSNRLAWPARLLIALLLLLVLVQFLPWHRTVVISETLTFRGWGMVSPLPLASLESGLFVVALAGFALHLARLGNAELERCLRFVVIGFLVNLIAGLVQLSFDQRTVTGGVLPYSIRLGLMANENHFSTLIFMLIPMIAWLQLSRSRRLYLYLIYTGLTVGFLFSVGSRAGMTISLLLALLCLAWFLADRVAFAVKAAAATIAGAILAVALWQFGAASALSQDLRAVFFETTLRAITDNWLTGTGLGTFTSVYPAYEAREATIDLYANNAHNDYLEVVLEGGVFGAVLIGFYFALILRHGGRTPLTQAAFLAIAAVALHSLVDYPLRTFAVATPFVWLSVLILSSVPDTSRIVRRRLESQPDFVAHRDSEPDFGDVAAVGGSPGRTIIPG